MQTVLHPFQIGTSCFHDKLFHLGWESGAFSDVTVKALGVRYPAHRILLSQSPFFEKLLRGPWRDACESVIELHVDDPNIESHTISYALQFLYGRPVQVDSRNVFGILAVGCFLDLEPLCQQCVGFVLSDLTVETFAAYYTFSRAYEYGDHTAVIRQGCLDFVRLHGWREARGILGQLDSPDLIDMLWDDELWVPSERHRYELVKELLGADLASISESGRGGLNHDTAVLTTIMENLRYEHVPSSEMDEIYEEACGAGRPFLNVKAREEDGIKRRRLLQKFVTALAPRRCLHLRCKSDSALLETLDGTLDGSRAFRVGLNFPTVGDVCKRKGVDSEEVYYAGSLWRLRLAQRRPKPLAPSYIGVFVHRRPANETRWEFCDRRDDVSASLKVRMGWASWKVNKSCDGRFNSETWDSYGWPQFMKEETLGKCLEADGSLRVILRICLKF
ncbi:hypothetical protein BSKO_13859 [Bryopsis sp. KO-2023]|nr:hypothetical protein BSKO_13859 [Bryopsis sp. KO-2023]